MSNSTNTATVEKEVLPKKSQNFRKSLKDYFFDFFMLFLAVTSGFFVNNLNENLSDRQREKQYMVSLLNDLRMDTTQIREIQSSIENRIKGIDSLMQTLEKRDHENFISNLYFFSLKYLNTAEFYSISDGTISQLKFSGGLRLVQKKGESDQIVQYYSSAENVEYNTQFCLKEFDSLLDVEKEIFDFGVLRFHNIDTLRYLKDIKLLIDEPLKLDHFYNQILMYTSVLMSHDELLTELKKDAESLISSTRERYRLD